MEKKFMQIKSYLIFFFIGLNLFFGLLIILNELHFTFYRFYTPMLMNPTLTTLKIDFAFWLISSIIILASLFIILIKIEKTFKKALLILIFLSTLLMLILIFNFKLTFLILNFWFAFLLLACLINLKLKISWLKLLSSAASPLLFLIALITFLSSLFLILHLRNIYLLPIELEGKISLLNIQIFYALYPLNKFFLLALMFLWVWSPLTNFLKLNNKFDFFNRITYMPLISSLILGIVLIELPYLTRVGFIGVDAQWYFNALNQVTNFKTFLSMFINEPRSFYLAILWFITFLGFSKEAAVKMGPAFLSIIHIFAIFAFINAIIKNKFLSGLSSFLAVFSFQTTVGMYAGIYANWFSLSTAILSLTFLIKAIKEKLKFIIPSIAFLIVSMFSHPWTGIIIFLMLIVYALINLIYSVLKKFRKGLKEALCVLSLIAINLALIAIAFIKPLGLTASFQTTNQILQSIKFSNIYSFLENLDFALKFYVGGFFIAPLIYLLGLASASLIFKNKILLKLFSAWFITTLPFLIFSDLWLKWRILYLMPFQILSGLGYAFIMKNICKASLKFKILFSTVIFLQLFNYTLQCLLFIPEY
jgi:hypothetical protein